VPLLVLFAYQRTHAGLSGLGLGNLACPSFFDAKPKHATCTVTQERRDSRGVKATERIGLCMLLWYITTPSNSFFWGILQLVELEEAIG